MFELATKSRQRENAGFERIRMSIAFQADELVYPLSRCTSFVFWQLLWTMLEASLVRLSVKVLMT